MTRLAVAMAVAASGAGCFYTSPINDRPSADLVREFPISTPYRGQAVSFSVDAIDPNGDPIEVTWTATACGPGGTVCDTVPYRTGTLGVDATSFSVEVDNDVSTRSVRVAAHTVDSYGAPALIDDTELVEVADRVPTIEFSVGAVAPPGGPTQITAIAYDLDDAFGSLEFVSWEITSRPFPATGSLTFLADNHLDPDRTSYDQTYELVPDADGTWEISVTVADPIGATTTETVPLLIGTDQPPCIAAVAPALPPPGNTMPLDQPRRFDVLDVEDDLDLFPAPPPDDPFYGAATFTWYLASPASGGAYVELSGVDSGVELDPAAYAPGDELLLRVEVADRVPRTLPCPPGSLSCAIDPAADPPCFQRRTWSLEVQ